MRGDVGLSLDVLFGFLMCLARVGGLIAFVPLPGLRNTPVAARIVLTLAITLCLAPVWPAAPASNPSLLAVGGWVLAESAVGLGAGLAVSLLFEGFLIAAQVLGLQAGYSYASTIDPNSQADTGILQVWMQLFTAFLFFSLGIDRHLIRAFAAGFSGPATAASSASAAEAAARLCTASMSLGLRVAFPVVILLLLVDIALAMTGRLQAQLQLLSLAFPAKMLAALFVLAMVTAALPPVFEKAATQMLRLLPALGS